MLDTCRTSRMQRKEDSICTLILAGELTVHRQQNKAFRRHYRGTRRSAMFSGLGLLAPVTDDQGEVFRRDLSPYPAALLELLPLLEFLPADPAPGRGGVRRSVAPVRCEVRRRHGSGRVTSRWHV